MKSGKIRAPPLKGKYFSHATEKALEGAVGGTGVSCPGSCRADLVVKDLEGSNPLIIQI